MDRNIPSVQDKVASGETIIKFEGVSKKFRKTLKQAMFYGFRDISRNILGLSANPALLRPGEFWALDNVFFEIKKGETLGIIGPNGAGKTTILKLISGIILPDKGRIEVNGKVGSLIEIGAGFHPMLTGRENIYVNASILGMRRKEIEEKMESIINFADIGEFIDSPVKYYSSGMYVRLGFSVAIHCEPDILLVDEVLTVGDEAFQRKSAGKIRELLEKGTTVILVSHNLGLVQTICRKVMWLYKGRIEGIGPSEEIISKYLLQFQNSSGWTLVSHYGPIPISKDAEITEWYLLNERNEKTRVIRSGEESFFVMKIRFLKRNENPHFGLIIKNEIREMVYHTNTSWQYVNPGTFEEGESAEIMFRQKMSVREGNYSASFVVSYCEGLSFCDWKDEILSFTVISNKKTEGILDLNSEIIIRRG